MLRIRESYFSHGPTPSAVVPVMCIRVHVDVTETVEVVETSLKSLWEQTSKVFEEEGMGLRSTFFLSKVDDSAKWQLQASGELMLAIQNFSGQGLEFLKIESAGYKDEFWVRIAFDSPIVAGKAVDVAVRMINRQLEYAEQKPDPVPFLRSLVKTVRDYSLDFSTLRIRDAAKSIGVPVFRIDPHYKSLQLGTGRHRVRFLYTNNDTTSFTAAKISSNKAIANRLLRHAGLPVANQRSVNTKEEALEAAREIGYPVVVKPRDLGQGVGVSLNLQSDDDFEDALSLAFTFQKNIIVEKMMEGQDYRIIVANEQLISVALRTPAKVIGDDQHTVAELVEIENARPVRSSRYGPTLKLLPFDSLSMDVLKRQGLSASSVPAQGEAVLLREAANSSQGGEAIDVSHLIHPDNEELAITATALMGLDVSGVDLLISDISQSWKEVEACIIEVNTSPGFVNIWLAEDDERQAIRRLVGSYFPSGKPSAVPAVLVSGKSENVAECGRLLEAILQTNGSRVGRADSEGLSFDGKSISDMPSSTILEMYSVLAHPEVDVAIIGQSLESIEVDGLPLEKMDAWVLTEADFLTEAMVEFLVPRIESAVIVPAQSTVYGLVEGVMKRCGSSAELLTYSEGMDEAAILAANFSGS